MAGKTSIADYMVVASGSSGRHISSLADILAGELKDNGYSSFEIEGKADCNWVLFDAGAILVHLFKPEVRELYNLEKLWSVPLADADEALNS